MNVHRFDAKGLKAWKRLISKHPRELNPYMALVDYLLHNNILSLVIAYLF